MRARAGLVAVSVVVGALVSALLSGSPASAFGETNADIDVAPTADVNHHGTRVTWKVLISCPAKLQYHITARVDQLNPPGIPELAGEDFGVKATFEGSGKCTRKPRQAVLHLVVQPTTYTTLQNGEFVTVTRFVPLEPTSLTSAQAVISGDGFFAGWASGPANCCEDDGPRIRIV